MNLLATTIAVLSAIVVLIVLAIIVIGGRLACTLAVAALESAVTKTQADWRPRHAPSRPNQDTTVGMLRRSKRLEGWNGVFKGLGPGLGLSAIVALSGWLVGAIIEMTLPERYSDSHFLGVPVELGVEILAVPISIVSFRTMVHPTVLPWSATTTLRAVLTPEERSSLWRLLRWELLLLNLITSANTGYLRHGEVPWLGQPVNKSTSSYLPDRKGWSKVEKLACFVVLLIVTNILLAPLHCAYVRLAIQRPVSREASPSTTETNPLALIGAVEPVVALRPITDASQGENSSSSSPTAPRVVKRYEGIVDCLRTMVEEEGWQSIFRGCFASATAIFVNHSCHYAFALLTGAMSDMTTHLNANSAK